MKSQKTNELITSPNDSRITKWGQWLRLSKLDEIPQLINIVEGKMRFVGPRPEVEKFFNKEDFFFLQKIKPGITDLSSILFRNENHVINRLGGVNKYPELLKYKIELCKIYALKKSFFFDLYIVFLTIISIFYPKLSQKKIIKIIRDENNKGLSEDLLKLIF